MKVTHLYHSGILIEDDEIQIFIDPISEIHEKIDTQKTVYFIVTHCHTDHFDNTILDFAGQGVFYILSDDIRGHSPENCTVVRPNRHYSTAHFEVATYDSTDCGISVLLTIGNKRIFHAGDLNWWHWVGDTEEAQQEEESNYKRIVRGIEATAIDVAFIPCDPRLNDASHWAIDYFLTAKIVRHVIPIHFRTNFEVVDQLIAHFHGDSRIIPVSAVDQVVLTF